MINWKKEKKFHKDNKYFSVVFKLRQEMIAEIKRLNKKHKLYHNYFVTKKWLNEKPTEIIILYLTDLIVKEKYFNKPKK